MRPVDRSISGRAQRTPDLFLCHSSRDKEVVLQLAEDLSLCGVDVWLDEWELHPGEDLYRVIGDALQKARYVGLILGENFGDSEWPQQEMDAALARQNAEHRALVLPIVIGGAQLPPFLVGKLHIDLRESAIRFGGLALIAAHVQGVPPQDIHDAIRNLRPQSLGACLGALADTGLVPTMVLSKEDAEHIMAAGGETQPDGTVRFNVERVAEHPGVPGRLRRLMKRLEQELADERGEVALAPPTEADDYTSAA